MAGAKRRGVKAADPGRPSKRRAGEDLEQVEFDGAAGLRRWLEKHHAQTNSVWLVLWKTGAGARHVPVAEVVDQLLCFGWIDSVPRKLDAERSLLLASPRKAGSGWSKVNKGKIVRLIAAGQMRPAGLVAIERAKADGSWSKLDAVDALEVPNDLAVALGQVRGARATFDRFSRSQTRGILEWIAQAKRAETRATRVAETARLAGLGLRALHPESRGK